MIFKGYLYAMKRKCIVQNTAKFTYFGTLKMWMNINKKFEEEKFKLNFTKKNLNC